MLSSLALSANGCTDSGTTEWIQSTTRGDSTFVTIAANAAPPSIRCESFDVVWQSDSLVNPVARTIAAGRVFVADETSLHVLEQDGHHVSTVGRSGEGPGEFRQVSAIGIRADTTVVLDSRLQRLSLHDLNGTYLTSYRTNLMMPYVSPSRGQVLRMFDDGVLLVVNELINYSRPTRSAIVLRGAGGDSVRVLREWEDVQWQDLGGRFMAHSSAFPARALIAIGEAGTYAHGNGLEYCVSVESIDNPDVLQICRGWSGADKSLWVRTIGPEYPDVHPNLLFWVPAWQPTHRVWDVYSSAGVIEQTVRVTSAFDLRIPARDAMWGVGVLDSGEKVIARVNLSRCLTP